MSNNVSAKQAQYRQCLTNTLTSQQSFQNALKQYTHVEYSLKRLFEGNALLSYEKNRALKKTLMKTFFFFNKPFFFLKILVFYIPCSPADIVDIAVYSLGLFSKKKGLYFNFGVKFRFLSQMSDIGFEYLFYPHLLIVKKKIPKSCNLATARHFKQFA